MGFRDTNLNRRDFLKVASASAGVLAIGQFLPPRVAEAARQSGLIDGDGDGYIPTMCEMCVWRCGVLAKVRDGRVVKLEGNPDNPHSKGRLCARGQSGLMTTYDPDRVLKPLIRVGPRGGGQFREASWEEALSLVAAKLSKYKSNEVAVISSARSTNEDNYVMQKFARAVLGTNNIDHCARL